MSFHISLHILKKTDIEQKWLQHGWIALLLHRSTATVQQILEAFSDHPTIEQCFH